MSRGSVMSATADTRGGTTSRAKMSFPGIRLQRANTGCGFHGASTAAAFIRTTPAMCWMLMEISRRPMISRRSLALISTILRTKTAANQKRNRCGVGCSIPASTRSQRQRDWCYAAEKRARESRPTSLFCNRSTRCGRRGWGSTVISPRQTSPSATG